MKQWTTAQRIVFLVAMGWVVFSVFSGAIVRIHRFGLHTNNSLEYYLNAAALAEFPHAYVFGTAMFTLLALLLALGASQLPAPWMRDSFRVLLTLLLLVSLPPLIFHPGHGVPVYSISLFLNSLLVVIVCLAFMRIRDPFFESK